MIKPIVYLNGRFLPGKKAQVSVFDRGFLFGDGVYEVIAVCANKPIGLKVHLGRLQQSLAAICFDVVIDLSELEQALLKLLKVNKVHAGDYLLYVQITRGGVLNRSFYFPPDVKPTIFATVQPTKFPTYEELREGKKAITLSDIRWKYCYIKTTSLMPSVLMYNEVRNAGGDEGILVRAGMVIEGISSNVFIVRNNKVITPPLSKENLSGVTRNFILQLLKKNKIAVVIKKIPVRALSTADEVWVTSSTRGIFPIVQLNGKRVGNGKPGVIWKKICKLYFEHHKN